MKEVQGWRGSPGDFTAGAVYAITLTLAAVAEDYTYAFNATDGRLWANGAPTVPVDAPDVFGPPDYEAANPNPAGSLVVGTSFPLSFSIDVRNVGSSTPAALATLAFFDESSPSSPFGLWDVPPIPAGGSEGPFTALWTSPSNQGSYTVWAVADRTDAIAESDEANNVHTWRVDVVQGPVTTLEFGRPNYTAVATYVTSSTPFTLSVLDRGGSGIRRTLYRIDGFVWIDYAVTGAFTLVGEGEHLLEWYSEDFAGNVETARNASFRVDDTPPFTVLEVGEPNYVAASTFLTSFTPLTLTATDGGAVPVGLAAMEYRVDDGDWASYESAFALIGQGARLVGFRSVDLLGNAESPRTSSFVVDDTPPSAVVEVGTPLYVASETYVTSGTPLSLLVSDRGVVPVGLGVVLYRFADDWIQYTRAFTVARPDGPKAVEYRAADRLGNEITGRLTLVLDDTPPTTTSHRTDGVYPPGTAFAFTAMDGGGSGVVRTEVRVDGGVSTAYSAPLVLPEGQHSIWFRSVDHVNNTEEEQVLFVEIVSDRTVRSEPNHKPVVALVFALTLALVGAWSARRAPWPTGVHPRLRAFAFVASPFVLSEAATGVVSLFTGGLTIPPLLGVGTAVDLGLLLLGIAVSAYRALRGKPS